MAAFTLRLEDTYWLKGFFNVPVDVERFVSDSDGAVDLFLGDAPTAIVGRVDRSANRNGTPRIFGNKVLANYFQQNYVRGARLPVEIISTTALRIGGRTGATNVA